MPVITFLSDMAAGDPLLVSLKETTGSGVAGAVLLDMAHDATLNDLLLHAHILKTYQYYPAGSIHISLITGNLPQPALLLAVHDGHFFIGQDNGVLPFALPDDVRYRQINTTSGRLPWQTIEKLLVVAVTDIINGGIGKYQPVQEVTPAPRLIQPRIDAGRIECNVLMVNNFGNLTLNLTQADFQKHIGNGNFELKIPGADSITRISDHYYEVPPGELLCRFNKYGYLELAVNRGRAADRFQSEEAMRSLHYLFFSIYY